MPNIANLSLPQLRSATKAQIITAIANYLTNNFTKRQIIGFLLDAEVVADPPARTYRTDGQIESETITDRDAESGAVVTTRQMHWSYYPTGEVDTITIDQEGARRVIKHYLDGQRPTVTVHAQPAVRAGDAPASSPRAAFAWPKLAALALLVLALTFLAFYLSR